MRSRVAVSLLGAACIALSTAPALAADTDLADGAVARLVPNQTDWLIQLPASDKPVFRGMLGGKGVGADKGGTMLYGPGAAAAFAMLVTHAIVSNAVLSSQQRAEQEEADKVLAPYLPLLDTLSLSKTVRLGLQMTTRGGLKAIATAPSAAAGAWLIESTPVFTLTQDERALVLDNAVVVRAPEPSAPAVYKGVVRVVSNPRPAGSEQSTVTDAWLASDGGPLRREAAALWADSLDMVLAELGKGPSAKAPAEHKTIRFMEGGAVKVERASVVEERCDRLVIKTLRGWLMSVPARADAAETRPCEAAARP